MKVALVQFHPDFVVPLYRQDGDALTAKKNNLERLFKFITDAAKEGAKLVVLPELCTTGYSFMSAAEAAPHAEPLEDTAPTFRMMRALAKKHRIHIVWGFIRHEPKTGQLFNSQALVTPGGRVVSYDKINFFGNDWLWSEEGRANPPILSCNFGDDGSRKVGLLICRDVRDKKDSKWSDFYESGDADLVCLSANWGDGGFPATTWVDFVRDNKTTLLVSNRWGKEVPNDFGEGGVCAITADPFKVHCEGLVWNQDCIVYAEI